MNSITPYQLLKLLSTHCLKGSVAAAYYAIDTALRTRQPVHISALDTLVEDARQRCLILPGVRCNHAGLYITHE